MDNSDYSRNRNNEYLGVNKIGKNIRKSPLHQPNFTNPARQQPQPQVYNINKNDFQSIVQQLTGSPSRHSQEPLPRPPLNSPKPASMRLQRIRPSPLTPLNIARPRMPVHHPPPQEQMPPHHGQPQTHHGQPQIHHGQPRPPSNGAFPFNARPPQHGQPRPPPAMVGPPMNSGDHPGWSKSTTAESPISQYMRYLQHSIIDSAQGHPQYQQNPQSQQNQMQSQNQIQAQHQQQQHQSSGLLPYPLVPPLPSPRMNGGPPRMGGPPPPLPSPRMGGPPPPLPSPTSQFLLPSPSGYLNLLSPRSPYPLLSPGYQYPPPLTPNFSFSPMNQPGPFGPGSQPLPPSPGMGFPSPGFFSIASPRWRD